MRLSARTEYAALAVVELARRAAGAEPVGIRAICAAQGVPAGFLVQILLQLKRAGIVTSVRGARGGYRLSAPAERITLREVEAAVEGDSEAAAPVTAARGRSSPAAAALLAAWRSAAAARAEALEAVTIADLVTTGAAAGEPMYFI